MTADCNMSGLTAGGLAPFEDDFASEASRFVDHFRWLSADECWPRSWNMP